MTFHLWLSALATILPGWWQFRTLVQSAPSASVSLRCLAPRADWPNVALPPAITHGCGAISLARGGRVACARGGTLTISGTATPDRFDIIARRIGPVAAHPAAVAVLHVEGERIDARCPTSLTSKGEN
jgi:hypothetical protein